MTAEQLALFAAILVIWVLLALGVFPWLQGRVVRRDLRIIGYVVLLALLVVSLLTAPSLLLWLEYMSIALVILIALFIYNHWVLVSMSS